MRVDIHLSAHPFNGGHTIKVQAIDYDNGGVTPPFVMQEWDVLVPERVREGQEVKHTRDILYLAYRHLAEMLPPGSLAEQPADTFRGPQRDYGL